MSELKLEFVSKKVKDMYGTFIGKAIGINTDIEGSIESISVDCGSSGTKSLPYEQLLIQGDYVIFIPRWRLDAQKLLREKALTLKRIRGLQEIVNDNDDMKEDAELAYLKYEKRLDDLGENTKEIVERLHQRISELDVEGKRIKVVLFDAKLQYKSNEITEDVYQQINLHTNELFDRINLEKTEIKNIINKLTQQTIENNINMPTEAKESKINVQDENMQGEEIIIAESVSPTTENHNQIHQESDKDLNYNVEVKEEIENPSQEINSVIAAESGLENIENNKINQIMATND